MDEFAKQLWDDIFLAPGATKGTPVSRDTSPIAGCKDPQCGSRTTTLYCPDHIRTKKETTGENSQKALRYNSGKLRLNLLPWEWQKWLVELLMVGAKKYSPDNWKASLNTADHISFVSDRKESLKRHLLQYDSGELTDEESGIRHMVMIAWNALVIAWYDNYKGVDPSEM